MKNINQKIVILFLQILNPDYIFSMQGLKRKRRCEIECKDHLFSLHCLKPNSSKYDIKLLFCPKFQREPLPPEFIHPQYNNDFKYYTSAFILGIERRLLIKNEQQEIMDHQKQIRDSLEKYNQLIFPRPNSKHTHCSVCKEHYKNYYFHISLDSHRDRIAASPYNIHINNLCQIYQHLWEGAEERADEEAQRLAAEYEEELLLRQSEVPVREEEQPQQSLLDVQRGQEGQFMGNVYEEGQQNQTKSLKKSNRALSNYDDTVPLRNNKRLPPSSRIYQSQYLRKKLLNNNMHISSRLQREREQRRYQREREKIKTERDSQLPKQFTKMEEKEGDVFIIMKREVLVTVKKPLGVTDLPAEFVWKRTAGRRGKQADKIDDMFEDELSEKMRGENRKYEIHYDRERQLEMESQYDKKAHGYSTNPNNYNSFEGGKYNDYKLDHKDKNQVSSIPEQYRPPYYDPSYPVFSQYPHNEKYDTHDRLKAQKGYHYQNFQYPYPSFRIPNPHDPSFPSSSIKANSQQPGSTNININIPMYMYPPQGHHSNTGPYPPQPTAFPSYAPPTPYAAANPPSYPPSRYPQPPNHYQTYQYPYEPNERFLNPPQHPSFQGYPYPHGPYQPEKKNAPYYQNYQFSPPKPSQTGPHHNYPPQQYYPKYYQYGEPYAKHPPSKF